MRNGAAVQRGCGRTRWCIVCTGARTLATMAEISIIARPLDYADSAGGFVIGVHLVGVKAA